MKHFLKLIRFPNLLIVALTQYLIHFCIVHPLIYSHRFAFKGIIYHFKGVPQLSELDFFLLVLSTVFLTAAGYVINDYFDRKTDLLNRPDSVVVGNQINRRTAMQLHFVFNIFAIILGFYVSYKIGFYEIGYIFLIVTGILWYYSTTYKRQFLIGNVIVAIFAGMLPIGVVLFDILPLSVVYKQTLINYRTDFNLILLWGLAYGFFAFITTLSREIIKDIEDLEGDNAYGRNTLPIILGINTSKIIVIILNILTIIGLFYAYYLFLTDNLSLWYFIIALTFPILFLIFKLIKAETKRDYHFLSNLNKIIMLLGILYAFIVYYQINNSVQFL